MELNFKYTDGGVVKYLTLNVEEHPEFVLNYSSWSGTWKWLSGGGVGNEKRYFNYFSGSSTRWPYIGTALNQFADWDGDNVLALDSSSHFYEHLESTYEWGAWNNSKTLEFGEGGTCLLNWYIFTDRSVNPPVDYIRANGLYDVRPAGGESNGANQPFQGNGTNPGYYPYNTTDAPKMAFWLIRMYDDVATSDTYQQYFDCLLITIKGQNNGQGSSYQAGAQVFDMRLFEGAKKPVPPSRSTTQGNTPNGFRGGRDDHSDSDTVSTIGTGLDTAFVNAGSHGVRLYRINAESGGVGVPSQYDDLYNCFWSENFWDKYANAKWNPLSGIISLHMMPCDPTDADGRSATFTTNQQIYVAGQELSYVAEPGPPIIEFHARGDVPDHSKAQICTKIFHPLEYSHSFLDWGANTRARLRLPFIGVVPVEISKIMEGGLFVKYNIDFLTGNCLVQVYTIPSKNVMGEDGDWDEDYGGCVCLIAEYSGNCAQKLNFAGNDYGGNYAAGYVGGVASTALSYEREGVENFVNHMGYSIVGGYLDYKIRSKHQIYNIPATANVSTMGMMIPALIIDRPMDITPLDENGDATVFETFNGRPAASGGTVKDYAEFGNGDIFIQGIIHADTLYATEAEKREIEQGFARGMYV